MCQFWVWAKICVSKKKNKYSNYAQCVDCTGEFMGQKWRIYGISDSLVQNTQAAEQFGTFLMVLPLHSEQPGALLDSVPDLLRDVADVVAVEKQQRVFAHSLAEDDPVDSSSLVQGSSGNHNRI